MNKTEQAYADRLEHQRRAGDILWWRFEPFNLNLAPKLKCFYKPDFLVLDKNSILEVHEVKGYWTDDARIKIKIAASLYPFKFFAVKAGRGGWEVETF